MLGKDYHRVTLPRPARLDSSLVSQMLQALLFGIAFHLQLMLLSYVLLAANNSDWVTNPGRS